MAIPDLFAQLESSLADSNAEQRKFWAQQIKRFQLSFDFLLPLLHGESKTAQRLTWLISDIAEVNKPFVIEALPMLFSLRDEMPFSGMQRSVAKWLQMTGVPKPLENEAIPQLLQWVTDSKACIASKSFAGKALLDLVESGRLEKQKAVEAISSQIGTGTRAFSDRMQKILDKLDQISKLEKAPQ